MKQHHQAAAGGEGREAVAAVAEPGGNAAADTCEQPGLGRKQEHEEEQYVLATYRSRTSTCLEWLEALAE
jgi:hypothetical protein